MINSGNIHQMKKGVFMINTARGGLIETAALEKALEEDNLHPNSSPQREPSSELKFLVVVIDKRLLLLFAS
jgi:hypothetical protein